MDENQVESEIIDILMEVFSENEAFIKAFPEDPQYDEGILNYTMTHAFCEILVNCDDIDFGSETLADQEGDVRIEVTVFAKNVRGENGARNICKKIRQALTGNLIQGNRPIPGDQRKIFYDGEVWCYGQHYRLNNIFPFGYEEDE